MKIEAHRPEGKGYFLGIDNGGTVSKAAIFDASGRELAVASASVPMATPAPGHTQRDMEAFWQITAGVVRRAVESAGIDPAWIGAVACTGHGKGLYLWGKDGKPARPGILSTDTRAGDYVARWREDGTAARAFKKTLQSVLVSQPCALLAWVRDHEREVYDNIRWVFEAKDYIRFRLTGEVYGELTDYSGTSLVNLLTRQYDGELLALFGLEDIAGCLPPLVNSLDRCGAITREAAALTGLVEGTPVAGGMFDIDACAIACGVTDEENICAIAGTWSINEYISKTPVTDGSVAMNSLFCMPEYYLIEESSPTSAGNLAWFIRSVLDGDAGRAAAEGISYYDELNAMVASLAPREDLPIFLPFLYGSPEDPRARGSFVGLTGGHTKAHMVRAIYEGVVFSHLAHIEKLLRNRDTPGCIRLAGGAANSPVWVQMFADVCGLPVETVPVKELGALGCAMTGAVMTGVYGDFAQAAAHMVPKGVRVLPNPAHRRAYRQRYRAFRALQDALGNFWPLLP